LIWRKVGKDPAPGPMAPQVEPPDDLSPAMMGYIAHRGRMDVRAVAATLVKLAQSRAVNISRDAGLYRISRTEGPPPPCMPEEKAFLDGLFSGANSLVVDRKHAKKALRSLSLRMKAVLKQEYQKYFITNSRYLWRFLWLSLIAALAGFLFLEQPFEHRGPVVYLVYGAFVLTVIGGLLFLFYHLLKTPTPTGRKLMDSIEGFSKFLTANYKRARFFDGRPETDGPPSLEKHLPYAMALGIDSEYVSLRMRNLAWYAGWSGGFSAHDLTSSLSLAAPGAVKRSRTAKRRSGGIG
jgi:hypothetical protein